MLWRRSSWDRQQKKKLIIQRNFTATKLLLSSTKTSKWLPLLSLEENSTSSLLLLSVSFENLFYPQLNWRGELANLHLIPISNPFASAFQSENLWMQLNEGLQPMFYSKQTFVLQATNKVGGETWSHQIGSLSIVTGFRLRLATFVRLNRGRWKRPRRPLIKRCTTFNHTIVKGWSQIRRVRSKQFHLKIAHLNGANIKQSKFLNKTCSYLNGSCKLVVIFAQAASVRMSKIEPEDENGSGIGFHVYHLPKVARTSLVGNNSIIWLWFAPVCLLNDNSVDESNQ